LLIAQTKVSYGWVVLIAVVLAAVISLVQGDDNTDDQYGGVFSGFVFLLCVLLIIGSIVYLAIWK
jgi:hypothetical protein